MWIQRCSTSRFTSLEAQPKSFRLDLKHVRGRIDLWAQECPWWGGSGIGLSHLRSQGLTRDWSVGHLLLCRGTARIFDLVLAVKTSAWLDLWVLASTGVEPFTIYIYIWYIYMIYIWYIYDIYIYDIHMYRAPENRAQSQKETSYFSTIYFQVRHINLLFEDKCHPHLLSLKHFSVSRSASPWLKCCQASHVVLFFFWGFRIVILDWFYWCFSFILYHNKSIINHNQTTIWEISCNVFQPP